MKTFIYSFAYMLIVLSSNSQEMYERPLPTNDDGDLEFTDVVEVGESKDVLYSRAREWFVTTYNSADDVLQMDDKESGKVIGKALRRLQLQNMGFIIEVKMFYTVSIYLKEGRYKYSISDIYYETIPEKSNSYTTTTLLPLEVYSDSRLYRKNGKPRRINAQYKEKTLESIDSLIDGLLEHMSSLNSSGGDDW